MKKILIFKFVSLFILTLLSCIQRYPLRGNIKPQLYKSCKEGNVESCRQIIKYLADAYVEEKQERESKVSTYRKITFYLQHSCKLRDWKSCPILGMWIAYLKHPCSRIVDAFRKACDNGLWYSCVFLAHPGGKIYKEIGFEQLLVMTKANCYPGKNNYEKKIRKAICLLSKTKRRGEQAVLPIGCKKTYSWEEKNRLNINLRFVAQGHYQVRLIIALSEKWKDAFN